jgi:hypothetical protein
MKNRSLTTISKTIYTMNNHKLFSAIIGCLLLVSACKKQISIKNDSIHGNWRFVETYDGYIGGSNTWQDVDQTNSHTLVFMNNGSYAKQSTSGLNDCKGTFILEAGTLKINSNCNQGVETVKVSELNSTSLILDYQGREGIIRHRYKPE